MVRIVVIALFLHVTSFAASYRVSIEFKDRFRNGEWHGAWEEREGYPKVPVENFRWLIPNKQKVVGVKILKEGHLSRSEPMRIEYTAVFKPMCDVNVPEAEAREFSVGEIYPAKNMGKLGFLKKHIYEVLEVPIYPTQIMVSEEISLSMSELTLVIETAPVKSKMSGSQALARDLADLELLGADMSSLSTYPKEFSKRENKTYLIVAPQEYLSDLTTWQLLEEKVGRGVTVGSHSIEAIQADFTGKDLQEKIRKAVQKHYEEDGTRFVLLVGNGYSSLPTRNFSIDGESIGSDLYFGCFDGELDLACEVAVGRAPVSNLQEYKIFVQKTLNAKAAQKRGVKNNTLLFGEKMDGSTLAGPALEQLVKGGSAGSISTTGFPPSANVTRFNETFSTQFSGSQVIAKLNEGNFYSVNHMGHANKSYCMRFQSTDISGLTNAIGFFGITQGCHPGDLHGPNWAAKLVLHATGGAYAQIANSSYGWYSPGSSDGPSNRHHLVFYDSLFREGMRELGRANMRAKERLASQANSSTTMKKVLVETNLFGDPEFQLIME